MGSKAMTIRIFDSRTDESVVIITDAKKSRIRELVAIKGSFWDIVKKMEDSLREEGCRYKCVFDSRTDKEDIAVAIGWSDGLDVHEDIGEAFDTIKDRLLTQFTEALHDSDMHVIDGDADSMIVRASNGKYEFDFLVTVMEA